MPQPLCLLESGSNDLSVKGGAPFGAYALEVLPLSRVSPLDVEDADVTALTDPQVVDTVAVKVGDIFNGAGQVNREGGKSSALRMIMRGRRTN